MSFAWVFLGPLIKIPVDIDEKTIFVDIMYNDQTNVSNIASELMIAEGHYRSAGEHIILGTGCVLSRAWCLYEIAVRREAGERSKLLLVESDEIAQIERLPFDFWDVFNIINARSFYFGWHSMWISMLFCKYILGIDWSKEMMSLSSAAVVESGPRKFDFFLGMEASKEQDLAGIRAKVHEVFGDDSYWFDSVIGSATAYSICSRSEMSLLLWFETLFFIALIPLNLMIAVISFVPIALFSLLLFLWSRGHLWHCWSVGHLNSLVLRRKLLLLRVMLEHGLSVSAVGFMHSWFTLNARCMDPFHLAVNLFGFVMFAGFRAVAEGVSRALSSCLGCFAPRLPQDAAKGTNTPRISRARVRDVGTGEGS